MIICIYDVSAHFNLPPRYIIRAKMNYNNLDDIHYLFVFYTNAKQCRNFSQVTGEKYFYGWYKYRHTYHYKNAILCAKLICV